jgi:hypothetical protein
MSWPFPAELAVDRADKMYIHGSVGLTYGFGRALTLGAGLHGSNIFRRAALASRSASAAGTSVSTLALVLTAAIR